MCWWRDVSLITPCIYNDNHTKHVQIISSDLLVPFLVPPTLVQFKSRSVRNVFFNSFCLIWFCFAPTLNIGCLLLLFIIVFHVLEPYSLRTTTSTSINVNEWTYFTFTSRWWLFTRFQMGLWHGMEYRVYECDIIVIWVVVRQHRRRSRTWPKNLNEFSHAHISVCSYQRTERLNIGQHKQHHST